MFIEFVISYFIYIMFVGGAERLGCFQRLSQKCSPAETFLQGRPLNDCSHSHVSNISAIISPLDSLCLAADDNVR